MREVHDPKVNAVAARTVKHTHIGYMWYCRHGTRINCQCCAEPEGFVWRGNSTCSYLNKGRTDS